MLNVLNRTLKNPNLGMLIIRLSIGGMMIAHGIPLFLGGSKSLKEAGAHMALLGIKFMPVLWGFLAALTQTLGGLLFAIGYLFRPVCIALLFTMIIATLFHLDAGHSFIVTSHALKTGTVFLGMMLIGPGRLSIDKD